MAFNFLVISMFCVDWIVIAKDSNNLKFIKPSHADGKFSQQFHKNTKRDTAQPTPTFWYYISAGWSAFIRSTTPIQYVSCFLSICSDKSIRKDNNKPSDLRNTSAFSYPESPNAFERHHRVVDLFCQAILPSENLAWPSDRAEEQKIGRKIITFSNTSTKVHITKITQTD